MVEVVNLILTVIVCCGLRLVMGFENGCGDCWWTGERERERDKSGHGKPNFGSLEANPVLGL